MHIKPKPLLHCHSQPLPQARLCLHPAGSRAGTLWHNAQPGLTDCHRANFLSHCYGTQRASSRAFPAMRPLSGGHMWLCVSKPLGTSSVFFTVVGSAFHDCGHRLILAFPSLWEWPQVWPKLSQDHTSCLISHHDQLSRGSYSEFCSKGILTFH